MANNIKKLRNKSENDKKPAEKDDLAGLMKRLNESFDELSTGELKRKLEEFTVAEDIPFEVKLDQLSALHRLVSLHIDNLVATVPEVAPALWQDRTNRSLTPPEFIAEVYAKWLGRGLTQRNLRQLDRKLYQALHDWLKHNDWPEGMYVPTLKEWNDMLVAKLFPEGHDGSSALKRLDYALSNRGGRRAAKVG